MFVNFILFSGRGGFWHGRICIIEHADSLGVGALDVQ